MKFFLEGWNVRIVFIRKVYKMKLQIIYANFVFKHGPPSRAAGE